MGTRAYFKIPPVGAGTAGRSFLAISYEYDAMGRRIRAVDPSKTILRMVYNSRGLVVSNWIGTNDREATDSDPTGGGADGNDMRIVSSMEYDDGEDGGDGNLTDLTQPVDDSSANDRIISYGYDFRVRLETVTETDGTTVWIVKTSYDNFDRALQRTRYQTSVSNKEHAEFARIAAESRGGAIVIKVRQNENLAEFSGDLADLRAELEKKGVVFAKPFDAEIITRNPSGTLDVSQASHQGRR